MLHLKKTEPIYAQSSLFPYSILLELGLFPFGRGRGVGWGEDNFFPCRLNTFGSSFLYEYSLYIYAVEIK